MVCNVFVCCSSKPKSELTEDDMRQIEEEQFQTGPLSVLTQSVKQNNQVCVCQVCGWACYLLHVFI